MPPPSKRLKTSKPGKVGKVAEITFDPAARTEYLTGFHKRKLQRKENAREQAVKREKEERVEERRQIREQRKEDLAQHVAQVNAELRKQEEFSDAEGDDANVDWGGVATSAPAVQDAEEEFVDEDKFTTVTVEPMGEPGVEEVDKDAPKKDYRNSNKDVKKRPPKKKTIKFRYETKAERQATRQKQKSKNHAAKARRMGE